MDAIAVIPARYGSTRLPGKPLLDICGKTMIQHVYDRVSLVSLFKTVIVATDDERIVDVVTRFGGIACLTSPNCASGSDRLVEVSERYRAEIYVNIQGDEPLVEPRAIETLTRTLQENETIRVGTLCYPISPEQARSSHLVKVVRDHEGRALYFSRSPIPFARDEHTAPSYYGHLGIYAYRRDFLQVFKELPPAPLEQLEKLEQLRILQAGVPIHVLETTAMGPGVDTWKDLEEVRRICSGQPGKSSLSERLRQIKLIITDIDGIFTDGGLYYGPSGDYIKKFNARDGLGIWLLSICGVKLAVLSGRDSSALRERLVDLKISTFELGQLKKSVACRLLMEQEQVSPEETLFIGDDLPDAFAFNVCGIGVTVPDAPQYIKDQADIVLEHRGGDGAFRELADRLLGARGYNNLLNSPEVQKKFC